MILTNYDWIVVNSSAGKDSQAMLDYVADAASAIRHRMVVVHADLGRMEWPGVKELAAEQAAHYGVRFEVVTRQSGDILHHARRRGRWPDSSRRWCTSDHKRTPVGSLFTSLVAETISSNQGRRRHVRILNCLGMRAEESTGRAKLVPFERDNRYSSSRRTVDRWLPIHSWTADQVWQRIRESGVRHHPAYDLGMPRLSCCFCIFAPRSALMLAGKHNRQLLDEYVAVERETGHQFKGKPGSKSGLSLVSIAEALDAGEQAGPIADWSM